MRMSILAVSISVLLAGSVAWAGSGKHDRAGDTSYERKSARGLENGAAGNPERPARGLARALEREDADDAGRKGKAEPDNGDDDGGTKTRHHGRSDDD